jgi:hypothetical protein
MLAPIPAVLYYLCKGSSTVARGWLYRLKKAELNTFYVARFEVLAAVLAKVTEFLDIMPY